MCGDGQVTHIKNLARPSTPFRKEDTSESTFKERNRHVCTCQEPLNHKHQKTQMPGDSIRDLFDSPVASHDSPFEGSLFHHPKKGHHRRIARRKDFPRMEGITARPEQREKINEFSQTCPGKRHQNWHQKLLYTFNPPTGNL